MAEWAVVLGPFIRSCLDTNMFNSILIRVKITIFYNCVFDIKGHKWFFQYVVVNLWCWASTIMPEASYKFIGKSYRSSFLRIRRMGY